jgi:crotonobetainyl-CoA:carnitine CoA-transferase CaiB-like acyl-CoA transferase
MQAESGLMSITGQADGPPNRLGVAFTDVVAGMVATQSVLSALLQRRTTGAGQFIDVSLLDSTLNLLINVGTGYLNAGVEPTRYGNAHPTVVPYQLFDTADGSFALAVGNDRMFVDFCEKVIHRPDLARDPRFVTSHQRAINRDLLLADMAAILRTNTSRHWLDACLAAEVPAGPVKTVAQALSSPSVTERGLIQRLDHPELGEMSLIGPAHGLAAQKGTRAKAPPLLGEDTRAILSRVLEMTEGQIADLTERRVVACHDLTASSAVAPA